MVRAKIQPALIKNSTIEYWTNHRVCPYCGYAALLMDGYQTRQCPTCGLEFNITTGLKPKGVRRIETMLTQAQADYMARAELVSNNYTKAKARVDRARKAHNLAPNPESYAKYIKALAESEQATKEYYS